MLSLINTFKLNALIRLTGHKMLKSQIKDVIAISLLVAVSGCETQNSETVSESPDTKCQGIKMKQTPKDGRIKIGETMIWSCECDKFIDSDNMCRIDLDGNGNHDKILLVAINNQKYMTYHKAGRYTVSIGECRVGGTNSDCYLGGMRYKTITVSDSDSDK